MLENREGQAVPEVGFKTRQGSEWVERNSQDIFAGKTVIVFSLPGAFTPTCSSSHVPRYNELAELFKALDKKLGAENGIQCIARNADS